MSTTSTSIHGRPPSRIGEIGYILATFAAQQRHDGKTGGFRNYFRSLELEAEGTGLEPATPLLGHHISSVLGQ